MLKDIEPSVLMDVHPEIVGRLKEREERGDSYINPLMPTTWRWVDPEHILFHGEPPYRTTSERRDLYVKGLTIVVDSIMNKFDEDARGVGFTVGGSEETRAAMLNLWHRVAQKISNRFPPANSL